jgi:hypothetical protein
MSLMPSITSEVVSAKPGTVESLLRRLRPKLLNIWRITSDAQRLSPLVEERRNAIRSENPAQVVYEPRKLENYHSDHHFRGIRLALVLHSIS